MVLWWSTGEVYFLPVERSELGGKYPPSGKSAHVPTREGQVFKAEGPATPKNPVQDCTILRNFLRL